MNATTKHETPSVLLGACGRTAHLNLTSASFDADALKYGLVAVGLYSDHRGVVWATSPPPRGHRGIPTDVVYLPLPQREGDAVCVYDVNMQREFMRVSLNAEGEYMLSADEYALSGKTVLDPHAARHASVSRFKVFDCVSGLAPDTYAKPVATFSVSETGVVVVQPEKGQCV